MAVPWIGPTAHPAEEFECLDCSLLAPLNVHGRCQRCGSNAVSQCHVLEKTGEWVSVGGEKYWVPAAVQCDQAAILVREAGSLKDDRKASAVPLPTAA